MAIVLNGTTGITTPDIDSTAAPDLDGSNITGVATAAQGTLADSAIQPGDSLASANLTGALPALDGSALTGISAGGLGTWSLHASGNAINTTNAYSFGSTTGTFFIEVHHDRSGSTFTGKVLNTSGAMVVASDGATSSTGGSVTSGTVEMRGLAQYDRGGVIVKTNGSSTYLYGFGGDRTYYSIWRML